MNAADNGIINPPAPPNRAIRTSGSMISCPPWSPSIPADMAFAPLTDLRAQLAAVININNPQQHSGHPQHPHGYSNDVHAHASSSASPHNQNIDPSIGIGGGMMSAGDLAGGDSGDENGPDGRKGGKRELSQSKRAAQNRAAQVRNNRFDSCDCIFRDLVNEVRELHSLKFLRWFTLLCQFSCHPTYIIAASIPSTQRGLYQETRGASEGIALAGGELQGHSGRELFVAGVYHSLAISSHRVSRRIPTTTGEHQPCAPTTHTQRSTHGTTGSSTS